MIANVHQQDVLHNFQTYYMYTHIPFSALSITSQILSLHVQFINTQDKDSAKELIKVIVKTSIGVFRILALPWKNGILQSTAWNIIIRKKRENM